MTTGHEYSHAFGLYSHAVQVPIDTETGQATGARRHSPITTVKRFNRSTPNLLKACADGVALESVEIEFYRPGPTGAEKRYYHILLEDVFVVSYSIRRIETEGLFADPMGSPLQEEIKQTYRRITWTDEQAGTQYADDWGSVRKTDDANTLVEFNRTPSERQTLLRIATGSIAPVRIAGPDGEHFVVPDQSGTAVASVITPGLYATGRRPACRASSSAGEWRARMPVAPRD